MRQACAPAQMQVQPSRPALPTLMVYRSGSRMAQVAAESASCMATRLSCPLAVEGLRRLGEELSEDPAADEEGAGEGVRGAMRGADWPSCAQQGVCAAGENGHHLRPSCAASWASGGWEVAAGGGGGGWRRALRPASMP